ncbi:MULTISPECIES: PA2169 family four-helix-bundle protein [unclassified Mucilaginibacter]|uniref:ferritin-like domain-containing protein n=1 Tax=unclassified Mucilaginibacter TaxID=2617802 RepID=UPI0031F70C03
MEGTLKNTADGLNHLIIIANDGKEGYLQATEIVGDSILKAVFARLAAERAEFADELRTLVQASGFEAETGGGPVGALHRVWVDIKTALVSNDEKSVLNECIRGDRAAETAYETVMDENTLTDEQRNILLKQLKLTRDALFSLQQELDRFAD